jgi:predicted  nucleic acid-binding Zn-ribbon protein
MSERIIVLTEQDIKEAPSKVIDLLANLAHRLTTLEQQVAQRVTDLERKLKREGEFRESLYRKISDMKDDIEMALDDIVTLDERTQPLATKKPSVAVAVKSIQQEFDGVFTKTEIDAYVAGEGFCLNGTFEFKGSVKGLNDAAEKISGVFK